MKKSNVGKAYSNDNLPQQGDRVSTIYGKHGEIINVTGSLVVVYHDDGSVSECHPTKVFAN